MRTFLNDFFNNYPLKTVGRAIKLLPSFHYHQAGSFYRRLFPRKAQIVLYTNNACNSRCIHCNHWQQRPVQFLSYKIIESTFNSSSVDKNGFLLEGGEILLHPELDKILTLFKNRSFTLLSNGILVDRLVATTKKFNIPLVALSLDGDRETYKKIRGVDHYGSVLKAALRLKKITKVALCFTQTPWNRVADYKHVRKICRKNGYQFFFNIYSDMGYMGQRRGQIEPINNFYDKNESLYARAYNLWAQGELKIPCFYMRTSCVVHPNGDVVLCQWKNDRLGNLYERSFEHIWNDPKNIELQRKNFHCRQCWVSSHKGFDIKMVYFLDKIFPKALVQKIIGDYQLPRNL